MIPQLAPLDAPELFIGLVAPIGVDLDLVISAIEAALRGFSYDPVRLRLTQSMRQIPLDLELAERPFIKSYKDRIDYANAVRRELGNDALAALSVLELRNHRRTVNEPKDAADTDKPDPYRPLSKVGYIIRQFKRPEEVMLLRRVYGRQFFLISAYAPPDERAANIAQKQSRSDPSKASFEVNQADAIALVAQDTKESQNTNGQNVRDAFPLADVIVDAANATTCETQIKRFFSLVFGNNRISPTRDEYGMYLAKSASLRTTDLSRQVGAAIFSRDGDVVSVGTNEVPRAGGGSYWATDENDSRDWVRGYDPNDQRQTEILADIIERLNVNGDLAEKFAGDDVASIVTRLLQTSTKLPIRDAMVMDILEFGRIIHAEMSAITDAARTGQAVRDGSLYCTTFPCHMCAKHIVAAGLKRVIYLEPYQKSYAAKLHSDSIEVERNEDNKVNFSTFIGISPHRYRDLFERNGKRKRSDGTFQDWMADPPRPNLDLYYPSYREAEERVAADFDARLQQKFPAGT